jgi:competence protein CoiA
MSIKKGSLKVHHFAHLPPFLCEYGAGETDAHRRCKTALCEALRVLPNATEWELERDLGSVRPDVSGYIGGQFLAIEVQASSLTIERISLRTKEYSAKKIPVLWIGLWHAGLEACRFSPSAWEKWLHVLYFGRVYYWREKAVVTPVHFADHMLWVEEREWYVSRGVTDSAGGYERRSKRWRESWPTRNVEIAEMLPSSRSAWSGGGLSVPKCFLWQDRLDAWW